MVARTSVTILLSTVILFVGTYAISDANRENQPPQGSAGDNASIMAENVYEGILGGAGPGIVYVGVAAIVMVALGVLVAAYSGGGR